MYTIGNHTYKNLTELCKIAVVDYNTLYKRLHSPPKWNIKDAISRPARQDVDDKRAKIIFLHKQNYSLDMIADCCNCSISNVKYVLRQYS